MTATDSTYTGAQISVLRGLEPVKVRPGMYTRTSHPAHILQEVIDNAADEALAGYAKNIWLTIESDGSYTIRDDGRGIPVDVPPGEERPAVELVFSTLHAGGKFDHSGEHAAYRFSGGLHGVGVAVTNALSLELSVEVQRDGSVWRLDFADGGEIRQPLTQIGTCGPRTHGTKVRVKPDPRYFDSPRVSVAELAALLRSKALLLPGLTTHLQAPGQEPQEWRYAQGLTEYLGEIVADKETVTALFAGENYLEAGNPQNFEEGEGASWALVWVREDVPKPETYVNLIATPSGGTHESGFRAGVYSAVQSFMEHHNLLPAKLKLQQEDVTANLAFLLSARILDPQFQGQTKERLNNRDAHRLLQTVIRDRLETWLNQNPEQGKAVAELALQSAQRRLKAAQKVERRKGSGLATLPGKLTDCESTDLSRNELFLVEGDSAGGSAKTARDKEYQAILPLRGKVLNTWEVDAGQIFANNEIHDIGVALGVEPHDHTADPDTVLAGLRYGKVILFADADVDGRHIQVLLLTLFYRHFPALLRRGHVFVAKPPLYRVDATVKGKLRKVYCEDERERNQLLERLRKEGVKETAIRVQRFKGLGEMNPEQLWETGMCPDTRTLIPLQEPYPDRPELRERFHKLMAKAEAGSRRSWLEADGWRADLDV
jgi:topoisomerase-4 subunit B